MTLRPRDGILDRDLSPIDEYLKKCDYYLVITEKEEEQKHIHACFFLKEERELKVFNRYWKRKYQYMLDEQRGIWKYLYVGKPVYNDDWISKYLKKNDQTKVIYSKIPSKDDRLPYYRDIEIQDQKTRSADPYFNKLERLWEENDQFGSREENGFTIRECNLYVIERFLCYLMFDARVIKPVQNAARMRRLCKTLVMYIKKSHTYTWERKDGSDGDVYEPPTRQQQCTECRTWIQRSCDHS